MTASATKTTTPAPLTSSQIIANRRQSQGYI
jgi:hypothetical protein